MRFLFALLLLASSLSSIAQTGAPDVTVDYVADAIDRRARTNEVLLIRNYNATVQWPSPRTFVAQLKTVITNAHDGVHYITNKNTGLIYTSNDRFAGEQDAAWWGAIGDASTDNTVALNAAAAYAATYIEESAFTTLKGPGRGFLRIRPAPKAYLITNTVNIRSSVEASGAALVYRGPTNVAYNALLVAPANPTSTFINNHTFNLPDVWGWDRGFEHTNSVGIRVQGIGRSSIKFPYVYRFWNAVEFLNDTEAVTLNTFHDGFFDTCRIGVNIVVTNGGYWNGNTWYGMRVNMENLNFAPGTTNGHEVIRAINYNGSFNGNTWDGGSWEGFPGQRLIYLTNASANIFKGMRLEHHVGDYSGVNASALYMEAAGNSTDNRIMIPNQGVNGMNGIKVFESGGSSQGNSGASSQWQEYRGRDNGYNHGPFVLTTSTNLPFQPLMTVYPAMTWPTNHWEQYNNWVTTISTDGLRFKNETDTGYRWYTDPSGRMIQANGSGNLRIDYNPIAAGGIVGYDDSNVNRIMFDRSGTLRFYKTTTGLPAGAIRPYHGSTFGGMLVTEIPTNELSGFTSAQTLANVTNNNAHYAFPGMDWLAGTAGTADYVYVSQGIYGPIHPHGYVQNRFGMYVDASSSSAFGSGGYTIAMPKTWMDYQIVLGPVTTPSFKVDQSSTAGDTRLSAWIASSNDVVRIKHDDTAKLFYTGASLNPAVNALVNAPGGSAGRVLSYVNSTTYAWSNAPSSFSFSDLTNAILAGSNISISYTATNMTISSSGGGGATNGTAVSVDGGSALSFANFADASKIGFTASGSNITATIVADSLGLADIDATTEAYFLNRTNHIGTQNWTTLHSTPTTLSGYGITDAQALDTDLTRIAAVTWATGDFVYRDATGLTNFASTSAGRALLNAVDAAAQRTSLGLGAMALYNDAPTNANAYVRSNGTWAIAGTGGSGTAVLVNGTNVSNPNFRRFFGISDSTNVDLLLSAGTNVTFSTNGNTLTIAATPGSTFTTNYLTVPVFTLSATNTVANSNTTETNLISSVASWGSTNLLANVLSSGSQLRLRAGGRFTATGDWSGGTLRLKVGGLTLSSTFRDEDSWTPSNAPWQFDVDLLVVSSGASATVASSGGLLHYYGLSGTAAGGSYQPLTQSGTLDTTASNNVSVTFQNASGQEITLVCNAATLEWVGKQTIIGGGSGSSSGLSSIQVNGVDGVTNLVNSATATLTKTNGTAAVNIASLSSSAAGLAPQATLANAVLATDGSTNVAWTQNRVSKTIASFRAQQGEPPASNYAKFSTRNAIGTLLFDPTTQFASRFRWLVPDGYVNTNVTVVLKWTTSATSGDARWGVRNWSLTGDIDSDSFATAVEATTSTSGTAGTVMTTTLSAVGMDSAVAGDWVYLEVYRDTGDAADTINSNDLELHAVEVRAE